MELSEKIKLLNEATMESLRDKNEDAIIKRFTDLGIRIIGAHYGFGWYLTEGQSNFKLAYMSPRLPYTPSKPRRKGGINAKAQAQKRPIFIPDVVKAGFVKKDAHEHMRGVTVIPMVYKGRAYGNIVLCYPSVHVFTDQEKVLSEAIGNGAAQAITIHRLYRGLEEFKYTLDRTLDSIFMFEPEIFCLNYVNHGATVLTGWTHAELLKKTMVQVQSYYSREQFTALLRPLVGGKERSLMFESIFKTKSGEVPVEMFIQYIPTAGTRGMFLGIARDITDRKQTQATLEIAYRNLEDRIHDRTAELEEAKLKAESEKVKTDAVLESMGEGIVVTDENGKVTVINQAGEDLLGYSYEEIHGASLADVTKMEDRNERLVPHAQRPVIAALKSGKRITGQYFYYRKDGSKLPVGITITPVTLGNQITGAVELFRDITMERQIDKAKTEFVSLASHQLRTPMSAINWYTEAVLREEIGKLNAKQKKYLLEVRHSNQRMISLVNALLNASRIELGTLVVEPEPLDLGNVAESIVAELTPSIKQKRLTVRQDYASVIGGKMADPKLIRIIMQNLVTNAIKYTPARGKVSILMGERKRGGKAGVLITVADTGFGIPRHQTKKVFSKLFRADNVKTRDTDGTGLGLYIVKSVVEYIGGSIWFRSVENKGTSFYVFLPLETAPEKESVKL